MRYSLTKSNKTPANDGIVVFKGLKNVALTRAFATFLVRDNLALNYLLPRLDAEHELQVYLSSQVGGAGDLPPPLAPSGAGAQIEPDEAAAESVLSEFQEGGPSPFAAERGRAVTLLDMEGPQSLGGQAWWSLGGLFMVDTPEQRRLGLKDSRDLAASDWFGSAGFDRAEDANPRAWAISCRRRQSASVRRSAICTTSISQISRSGLSCCVPSTSMARSRCV